MERPLPRYDARILARALNWPFKDADAAYQRAVQIDPQYAIAWLNLGVLCDLYLQQPERALEAYERYLSLAQPPDAKVNSWVTELKKRLGSEPRSARAE